jgi:dTDP-glucose 4,6-dehydratase
MNLLVTGGAGFIGSEFVRSALDGKFEEFELEISNITVLDALTYAGNLENLKPVSNDPRFQFVKGNICDQLLVNEITKDVDCIINFAAESHVDKSILNSNLFLESNLFGVNTLLNATLQNNVNKFVQISTDEVYGSITTGSWDENFPLLPNSPYSASKAGSELLIRSYINTYGLNAVITRCSNNYGPYQNIEKLIPLVITNLLQGEKVPVYGDGKNVREWIHVSDHARAIAFLISYGKNGETYNIGSGNEIKNIELVNLILEKFGLDSTYIEFVSDRPGHDLRYSINSQKINNLGFKSSIDFANGLSDTIDWYRNNTKWWKI